MCPQPREKIINRANEEVALQSYCRNICVENFGFFCLLDEPRFSDICTIMELKELNWLCKHMKNVRSSQPCMSMNFSREAQFLHVSIVNVSGICFKINYCIVCVLIFLFVSDVKKLCHKSVEKLSNLMLKQPPRSFLKKRCSESMKQIYRRTPMPKFVFNKVAKQSHFGMGAIL